MSASNRPGPASEIANLDIENHMTVDLLIAYRCTLVVFKGSDLDVRTWTQSVARRFGREPDTSSVPDRDAGCWSLATSSPRTAKRGEIRQRTNCSS